MLPGDFTREIPNTGLQWLLQYGLPWSYWKDQIGYSPERGRLVFLVGNPLQFSIGRLVEEREGNHASRRKWYVWGDSHKHAEVVGNGETVVLVEDLISAHKLAALCPVKAVPLFGTQVHPCHLWFLMQEQKPIVLWLDKDQESRVYHQAAKLQTMTGCKTSVVITDQDPKCLNKEQLNAVL